MALTAKEVLQDWHTFHTTMAANVDEALLAEMLKLEMKGKKRRQYASRIHAKLMRQRTMRERKDILARCDA